jgi:hypothetical protein
MYFTPVSPSLVAREQLIQNFGLKCLFRACLTSISVGRIPASRCVELIANPKSVIPACFKRESIRARWHGTPRKFSVLQLRCGS